MNIKYKMHGLWIVPAYCLITGTIGFLCGYHIQRSYRTGKLHTGSSNLCNRSFAWKIYFSVFFSSKNPVLFSQYNCNISDNHNSIGTGNA